MRARIHKHRAALLALLCLGLTVLVALFAADVSVWRSTVARDDLRFRALPAHRGLWRPATTLPGDPASLVIGTGSTISYRRALQYFWFSRIGSNPEVRQDTPTLRASAQNKLLSLISSAPTAQQRSAAANLLGVLVVTTPSIGDSGGTTQILTRAVQYFQEAIALERRQHEREGEPRARPPPQEARAREVRPRRAQRLRLRPRARRHHRRRRVLMLGVTFLTPLDSLFVLAAVLPLGGAAPDRAPRSEDPAPARGRRAPASNRRPDRHCRCCSGRARRRGGGAARRDPQQARQRARRRAGLHRPRHLAFDAGVGGPRQAVAAATRQADGDAPRAVAQRRAHRDRLDDRPRAPESDADDRPGALRSHGAAVRRHQSAAAEPAVQGSRDDVRRTHPARRVALLLRRGAAAAARRVHGRRVGQALAALSAAASTPRDAGVRSRLGAERAHLQPRRPDPRYVADPTSTAALDDVARITGSSRAFPESEPGAVARAARNAVGRAGTQTRIDAYARIPLAPWFVLGGLVPLGFLLWRRNG